MKTIHVIILLSLLALAGVTGCASSGDTSNWGKIGPDYGGSMSTQIQQQEALSQAIR